MRILAVSDIESKSLYDFFSPEKVEGVELIIGCGDLREEYLEFLVTMMNVPLLYIHTGANPRAASALTTSFMSTRASGLSAWAAPSATETASICTPRAR